MSSLLIFPPSESDDMKLRPEDKEWLAKEVANAAKLAVEAEADKFRPHGWRRFTSVLRELGIATSYVTIVVSLLALTGAAWYFAFTRVSKEATFETNTENDLKQLTKAVNGLQAQASVESVSSTIRLAKATAAKLNPDELKKLSAQLTTAEDQYPQAPEVWKATGEFINYKSDALTPDSASIYQEFHGMDCRSGGGMEIENGTVTFKDCHLSLDRLMNATGRPVFFIHCIVEYHGGQLPPDPLVFRDCLFRFEVSGVPPARGEQTMRLLAQADNIANVNIPS
jgi:hypothetical protein